MEVKIELAKKVITKDHTGKENGFLIELAKNGKLTTSYLSCTYPGEFKGYHLHAVRVANYVCVKGTIKIILYTAKGREEHILSAENHNRLTIPTHIPTGLLNEGTEEAWIINNPEPAYDPDLKGEQIDFTQEQLDALFESENSASNQLKALETLLLRPELPTYPYTFEGPGFIEGPGSLEGFRIDSEK